MAKVLYAAIYYSNANTDPDRSFERAARYSLYGDEGGIPSWVYEFIGVTTKQDFLNAWQGVRQQANHNNAEVLGVHIFSHASKQMNDLDGLEFADGPGGGTLTRSDIRALPRLPWGRGASLYLSGCNTGLIGDRGWCPADAFARGQDVDAAGEVGYSYFSSNIDEYREITPNDREVYLWAYRRGRNAPLGDGLRMSPAWYKSSAPAPLFMLGKSLANN